MRKMFGEALLTSLLALSMLAGAANAQDTTPPAAKKKTTPAKKAPCHARPNRTSSPRQSTYSKP